MMQQKITAKKKIAFFPATLFVLSYAPNFLIFSFETGDSFFYNRYQHNQNREHAFQSDIGDIVKKRPCPCMIALGCICREKKGTGEKTDKKSAEDGDKISYDHTVFLISEKSADSKHAESKRVVH